jgi:D-3-phosphoglycerate dehydrogenase
MTKYSLDKDKIKVLLLEGVHPNSVDNFKSAGYTNVEYVKGSLEEEALIEKIRDVHFIGIRSRTHLTERVLDAAQKLCLPST